MRFRHVDLVSIGSPSQELRPNHFFGRFPNCNYNEKLEMGGRMSFMGL